ncbi:hypothetical protein NDU88_002557 [Pleurodeles waltl]|uniref:Uncharacterized protein n=1 Tax=Pleurodeles waltl TaxID=8319 RepID=A0AAV7P7B2_PLEWA|nr:hypothetical protein NDU88_002557 [Pleurodeles waltl]
MMLGFPLDRRRYSSWDSQVHRKQEEWRYGNPDIRVPCEADAAYVARTPGRGVVREGESGLRSRFCCYSSRNIRLPATCAHS